jgi:hypothetical protein
MRIFIFFTLLLLANHGISQADISVTDAPVDSLPYVNSEIQELKNDASKFAMGKAETGLEYFQGVLAGIVLADLDMRRLDILDDQNAAVNEFVENGKLCLMHVASLRESMAFYTTANWPLISKFNELTIAWLDCVEKLVNDYHFKLAASYSKADEDWTDADWDLYEEYLVVLDNYYAIDDEWVEFQYAYAEANGFEIGFIIDEDAMLDTESSE